jgi:serine protease Do
VVPATIVGADKMSDIAVLKIQADGLVAARWGDSDKLEVGDPVLAIGNPFRLMRTVTAGIISATGRHEVIQDLNYQDLLQTDAAVNPGNSGGPLVNMQGHVVGINTAIVGQTYQGIGFAIPSNRARKVCQELKSSGKVAWGWLGVATQSLTPDQAKQAGLTDNNGAMVTAVVRNSPAAKVGIKPGDIIVRWNDRATKDPMELVLAVAATEPGSTATVELIRDGKKKTITVEVRERPAQAG